jgi:predicted RND superfamily exporter protein
MIKTLGEYIIFKLYLKKNVSGIIVERETKTADKFYIDKAEIFQVGSEVKDLKPGQEVILTGRPMYPLDIFKYLGEEQTEEHMYSRGKMEDVVAVIE